MSHNLAFTMRKFDGADSRGMTRDELNAAACGFAFDGGAHGVAQEEADLSAHEFPR
jgi:hypothetical protein